MNDFLTKLKQFLTKLKAFFTSKTGLICSISTVLVLAILGAGLWYWQLPKFQNVTIELGTPKVQLAQFLNENAINSFAGFSVNCPPLDYSLVGQQTVILTHLGREETVTLTIEDTTAPTASFQDLTLGLGDDPAPQNFVTDYQDLSPVTITFDQPLEKPVDYTDTQVTVHVTDAYGNRVTGQATISYVWLKEAFTMEYGTLLQASDLLLDATLGAEMIDQAQLDHINDTGVGSYTLVSSNGQKECTCAVTVEDTTPPALTLQEVAVYRNRKPKLEDFILSATDLSGEVTTRLITEIDTSEYGTYTITIEAEDIHGNITSQETALRVVTDTTPPTIGGLKAMTVEKNATPDYAKGVYANDNRDGRVEFTYDTSKVDLTKAGTYYITYTAKDESGNVATSKRTITVNHDASDTDALVAYHAARCGTSVESIRSYVRSYIAYNHNWGGDDPVWYGFTNKVGNCYVHALTLQRLLSAHGYESKLIWVTNKTHYWLVVNMGGYWRHVDATPTTRHSKYVLMDDEQRYETLSGRNWNRSQWPACE